MGSLSLLAAVGFLTRIRVPVGRLEDDALGRAVKWFPLVGAFIGALVGGTYAISALVVPPLLAATLAVTAGLVVTGGFHEDGLGDTLDALGGGRTPDDVRRILKDPRQGTFGVLALVVSFVVRVVALSAVGRWDGLALAIAAHCLARMCAVAAMIAPAAEGEGLGASYASNLSSNSLGAALGLGSLITFAAVGPWAMPAFVLGGVAAWLIVRKARARIGGVTGDFLGAIEQVGEMLVFTLGAAVAYNALPVLAWWH